MAGSAPKLVEKVEAILISEIDFDPNWNSRSNVETGSGGPGDDKNGFEGLVESIKLRGQDEAIIVREHPDKKSKKAYSAVTGFRRGAAIAKIAEETGNKAPTINAIIRKLTEEQARELNLAENTARDDLSGPDLAFGIHHMFLANEGLTDSAVAQKLGMNQTYISKLHRIMANVKSLITKDWRASTLKLTVDQMANIATLDKSEQQAKYEELLRGKEQGSARGKNAWIETTKNAMAKYGKILGTLARTGELELTDVEAFFDVTSKEDMGGIAEFVNVKDKANDSQRAKFSAAGVKAYEAALTVPDEEPEVKAPNKKKNGAASAEA